MSIWGPVLRVMLTLTSAFGSSRGTWQKLLLAPVPGRSHALLKVISGQWVTGMGVSRLGSSIPESDWRSRTALISCYPSP